MVQLPNAGTHIGKMNGPVVFAEASSGAFCIYLPVLLCESEIAWHGKHVMVLVNKDGEVQGRNLQTLKEVFGWDGKLETAEEHFAGIDPYITFDLVCEHEEFTPEGKDEAVMGFKVKWLNVRGGGSRMPAPIDMKSAIAKYGNKFRALSGGKPSPKPAAAAATPAKPAAKAAATPAKTPPAKGGPPAKGAKTAGGQKPTATLDEAWAACQAARPDLNDDQNGEIWYSKIEEMFGAGKTPDDLSIQDFGALKVAFETPAE
jgi:hypothetical protein